jgi:pseudouridine kinase
MSSRIVVFGGAHLDRRGRIVGDTVPGASNPGYWREDIGGGAFNVARNLALLGHDVTMISPRGGDAVGEKVTTAAVAAGIKDRPFVFLDRPTPSYTAILETDGNLVIALADMDLYRLFTPRRLRVRSVRDSIAGADLIVCDANLPAETLAALATAARTRNIPIAGIAISPAKVVHFQDCLPNLSWLFMNAAEASALTGVQAAHASEWPDLLRARGLKGAVVTKGASDIVAFSDQGNHISHPPATAEIIDVTGAGDALAAGTLDAVLNGKPLGEALLFGIAAARITLASPYSVAPQLNRDLLRREAALAQPTETLS